jgi:SAM-dependent methyltransferase
MDLSDTKALYEGLPFPLRNAEDESFRLITPPPDHLAKINHHCFAGEECFTDGFRALVAGGGTGDAAIFLADQLARRGNARVTYIDQSVASMEIARSRAETRGLTNIDWINGSILDLESLGIGSFDYINCVGVIHHLRSPIAGLQALSGVLKDRGVLCLMVYGRYGRQDITDARDLFNSYLSVVDADSILDDAKTILASLSPRNSYMRGRDREYVLSKLFNDLPNLADIFLNPVEFSYSAKQFAELVEDEAGLKIARFTSYDGSPALMSLQYNPDLMIADEGVRETLAKLELRERWKIAEIMDGSMHLHCAYVSRQGIQPADFRNNLLIPDVTSNQHRQLMELLVNDSNRALQLELSNGASFPLSVSAVTADFLSHIDGKKPIRKILLEMQGVRENAEVLLGELEMLAELEWICLRSEDVEPFLCIDDGQDLGKRYAENGTLRYEHPVVHKSGL